MPTLLELQREFLGAVLHAETHVEGSVVARGIAPARRLAVYANNARANFIEALRLGFPVILRLVGGEYFDQCARAYRAAQPSRSGDLNDIGAEFAGYLSELHAGGEYRYLGDVARLEWLCQDSLMAADPAPRLDPARFFERLAAVPPERYDGLKFTVNPTARLFASDHPAREIWKANLDSGEPAVIDVNSGGERLLLLRSRSGDARSVEFHRLTAGEQAFMSALDSRADLATALELAMTAARDAGGAKGGAGGAGGADSDTSGTHGDAGGADNDTGGTHGDTSGTNGEALAFDAVAALGRLVSIEAIVDFDLVNVDRVDVDRTDCNPGPVSI
jgi:hypothetical protein